MASPDSFAHSSSPVQFMLDSRDQRASWMLSLKNKWKSTPSFEEIKSTRLVTPEQLASRTNQESDHGSSTYSDCQPQYGRAAALWVDNGKGTIEVKKPSNIMQFDNPRNMKETDNPKNIVARVSKTGTPWEFRESGAQEQTFATISTLSSPYLRSEFENSIAVLQNHLTGSGPWKAILQLLQSFTWSLATRAEGVLGHLTFMELQRKKLKLEMIAYSLIEELNHRNRALFAYFTTLSPLNEFMLPNEEQKLMSWLLEKVQPTPPTFSSNLSSVAVSLNKNSPVSRLVSYYLEEWVRNGARLNQPQWQWIPRQSKPPRDMTPIREGSVLVTQVIINILGEYYKTTNRVKWDEAFEDDLTFIKIFLYLKSQENNRSFQKSQISLFDHRQLNLLPWSDPPTFGRCYSPSTDRRLHSLDEMGNSKIGKWLKTKFMSIDENSVIAHSTSSMNKAGSKKRKT